MPLQWSEPKPPCQRCHYDHVIADTPLGEVRLEWKSWKEHDSPCGHMPWGEFVLGGDLDEAKAQAQEAWNRIVPQVVALSSSAKEAEQ